VSAALPERQHQMRSCRAAILSDTRLATYVPVLTRLSAPKTTPSLNGTAMIVVPVDTSLGLSCLV